MAPRFESWEIEWSQQQWYSGQFRPVTPYRGTSNSRFEHSHGKTLPVKVLKEVIRCDIRLRITSQDIKWNELKSLWRKEKIDAGKGDVERFRRSLKRTEDYLTQLKKTKLKQETHLHQVEFLLPEDPLRRIYHEIRKDPKWYLRPELIKDCIARGGCCGRECGCCERRCVPRQTTGAWTPGVGHCTPECFCCNTSRGFHSYSGQRSLAAYRLIKSVSAACPAYLQALCDPYFTLENPPAYDPTHRSDIAQDIDPRIGTDN